MKLSEWPGRNGISYRTALRWYHEGNLPARAQQLPTGTILVYEEDLSTKTHPEAAIYARVSSNDQKADLERQVSRLKDFAAASGLRAASITEEIGSGLNGHGKILVEHRDRLARFGVEYMEAALVSQGRSIIVADDTEEMSDIAPASTESEARETGQKKRPRR